MEDLPHPQRSGSAAPWESREMPTGALMMASVCVRVSGCECAVVRRLWPRHRMTSDRGVV
jgi:hypothetical protein